MKSKFIYRKDISKCAFPRKKKFSEVHITHFSQVGILTIPNKIQDSNFYAGFFKTSRINFFVVSMYKLDKACMCPVYTLHI